MGIGEKKKFDKSNVQCYNYQKFAHFSYQCYDDKKDPQEDEAKIARK